MLVFGTTTLTARQRAESSNARTHTYYIAADEVEWDYAPTGINGMTGKPFEGRALVFVQRGPDRIGKVYRKAIYREYTDETFSTLKPRPPKWEHLGLLGPVLRAEVGDTIQVVFKNNASIPYSMHPHGVFYTKSSEGVPYNDGTSGADKKDDAVPPGGTHTYVWPVPERAGPGPNDPSSVVWLYHSHTYETKDVNAGLIGTIVVTARGMAKPDGTPKDVDREFVTLFMVFDENVSWYREHNIQTYAEDPGSVNRKETFIDNETEFRGFIESNLMFSINGFVFSNNPMLVMKKGERVRWYVVTLGGFIDFHTPHWHAHTVVHSGTRTDTLIVGPAMMLTADMVADNVGTWMYHCHVNQHLDAGMHILYRVDP
jgi:FtsP/CotA-like multicopper oxidase with cupredoxin domain